MSSCAGQFSGNSSISNNLSQIGKITQADALTAQSWNQANNFTSNPFTGINGVVIEDVAGKTHALIDLKSIPSGKRGNQNTITGLSKILDDTDKNVITAILTYKRNSWLLPALYKKSFSGSPYPGTASARRALLKRAYQHYYPSGSTTPFLYYKAWRLPNDGRQAILLPPITDKFKCKVFTNRLAKRYKNLTQLNSKIKLVTDSIIRRVASLKKDLKNYDNALQPYLNDIAVISASRLLLDVMIKHPKGGSSNVDADDKVALSKLRAKTQSFENEAVNQFVNNPVKGSVLQIYKSSIESSARRLRKILEDKELIAMIMEYRSHSYLITDSFFDDFCNASSDAFTVLMRTPESVYIKKHWADRLLKIVDDDSDDDNTIEINATPPTACDAILFGLSMVPSAAGNMPGPASFSVALMGSLSSHMIGRALKDPSKATLFSEQLARFIRRAGSLNTAQTAELDDMIKGGTLRFKSWVSLNIQGKNILSDAKLKELDNLIDVNHGNGNAGRKAVTEWVNKNLRMDGTKLNNKQLGEIDDLVLGFNRPVNSTDIGSWVKQNFQSSRNWGVILGIFNAALLIHSIRSSEAETIKEWVTVGNISLASNSGAAFVQALKSIDRLRNSLALSVAGETLGVLAGTFALLSSIDSALKEESTGDTHGAIVQYAGAFGAGLSLAGYFIGAGIAADATIFGAPLGTVLMFVGVAIGIVSAVWGFIRTWTTAHTHMQYEAFINYLSDPKGAKQLGYILKYDKKKYPVLSKSYTEIQKGHHSLDFWAIDISQHAVLFNEIFQDCQQVANALDMSMSSLKKKEPTCCKP